MPEGGEIIIEANAVLQRNMQQIVELRVSDSGIGMSPDTIRRAFDPFLRQKCRDWVALDLHWLNASLKT